MTRVLKAVDVLGVRDDADERRTAELAAEGRLRVTTCNTRIEHMFSGIVPDIGEAGRHFGVVPGDEIAGRPGKRDRQLSRTW